MQKISKIKVMVKKLLTFFVSAIFSIAAMAQDVMVSGKVTDANGSPLPGAIVVEKGTNNAVRTALDGTYKLTIPGNRVPTSILIRSTGAGSEEFSIDGKSESVEFNPSLGAQKQKISEVVVTSASKKSEKVLNAPASVSVLSEARIQQNTSLSVVDNLRKTAAVDIMPTGLVSNNVNVRGLNGIFSGSMLYLVDNRIASVPSLRVNAFQLVPTANTDLRSMEVVRGPASALYGPFASQGVLAMYTKSPLDMENRMEVTVGLTAGLRAGDNDMSQFRYKADNSIENLGILNPEIRIAGKISDRLGIKVSGSHMQATDFAFFDSREPRQGSTVAFGNRSGGSPFTPTGEKANFVRDFKIKKLSGDARLDWRPTDNTEIIFSGGYSNNTNMELTGLGAAQAREWVSNYFQTRIKTGRLFLQYFINQTNSGNTFLIPQSSTDTNFQYLSEKSNLQSFQAQHSSELFNKKLSLIYGADVFLTRPRGNVYGRFDNGGANINQYGIYGQGKYEFNKQWSFTGALRADYQDVIDEWMFSPRAAIMFKPTENRTIRLTYNRAFQAPGALNFFLDLNNASFPNQGSARGFGNTTGFQYGVNGNVTTANGTLTSGPFNGSQIPLAAAQSGAFAATQKNFAVGAFTRALLGAGLGPTSASGTASLLMRGFENVKMDFTDFVTGETVNTNNLNKEALKSTVNQTLEVGYKGYLMDKLSLGVDLYYTRVENLISPLTAASYSLTYTKEASIKQFEANLALIEAGRPGTLAPLKEVLLGSSNATDNALATALAKQLMTINNATSPAVIAPNGSGTGNDILLAYFNLGTIDYAGVDLQLNYQLSDDINVDFAYSFINKDKVYLQGAADGFVGLNAPQHKTAMNVAWRLPIDKKNVTLNTGWRWMDKFDANSAVYIGRVNAANLFDLGFSWKPSKSAGTILSLNANNLLDHRHMFFPGTPAIGRVVLFKIQHTFGVK